MNKRILSLILTLALALVMVACLTSPARAYTEGYDGMGPVRVSGGRRDLKWPVPNNYNIQSCFYDQREHYAIDISASQGTSVVASYAGTVIATYSGCSHNYYKDYTCCNDGYGNYVVLKHTYKTMSGSTITLYTRYNHLTSVSVSNGASVSKGQTIGTVGSTGYSQGFHLDYQILYGGWSPRQSYSIDPFNNQLLEMPSSLAVTDGWSCGQDYFTLIKAVYANPLTCTVTFNANGGSCSTGSKTVNFGGSLSSLPTPTRSGYTFDGWYTSASGGTKITTGTTFSYHTTVYAHWTVSSVDVNYYNPDGSVWKTQSVNIGSAATVPDGYPTLNGSYFSGWAYKNGAALFDLRPGDSFTVTAATGLYPVYVTHEQAISGEPVYIYNIEDFTDSGYDAIPTETTIPREVDTSYWTSWSGYSTTAVTASSTVEVRTAPMYRYYCYTCPYCGANEPYSGTSDCGETIPTSAFSTKWSTTAYSGCGYKTFSYTSEKYYTTSLGDGKIWCFDASNLNDSAIGTTNDGGDTVIKTGYSSRKYVQQTELQNVPTTAYVIKPHDYQARITSPGDCKHYATATYTCTLCGDSYSGYAGEYSDWSTTEPEGVAPELIETRTEYRYSDYETVTSYETSLDGYTRKSSAWVSSGTGSVQYVSSWPSGFSTSNSLYSKYNKKSSKVSASETETAKTVINSDKVTGYLYYHWCYTDSFYSMESKTGSYTTFHAFYSTQKPSDCANYDANDGSYLFPNDSCCTNGEWYWPVSVYTQSYTNYRNQFTYERWTDWSDWSETAVTASDTRKVESRTLYRYVNAQLGEHSYTSSVTAPTCTAGGYTTYTCTVCGDWYTGNETSASGHSYVDGSCIHCGEGDPDYAELFDIPLASMTMGNSLAINFAFEQSNADDWTGCYAQIVKTYSDGRENVVETVPFADWKSANIGGVAHYYVTFNGVAAKEMSDEIYVTICNASGNPISNTKTDSVRDQSMRALVKEGVTDKEKTMIVDMLNYGAAAQGYFGYGTDDLANNQLTAAQAAYASSPKACTNTRASSGNFGASTVVLKSSIQMMFAFKDVDASHCAVVTFTNHRGSAKTISVSGSDFTTNGNYQVVTVDALVVADGRQDVTCIVYNAAGTEVARVTDSLESYTARSTGENDLFIKMMQYSDSAYNFFHS